MTNTPPSQRSAALPPRNRPRRWLRGLLIVLAAALAIGVWQLWTPASRYALTGAAYGARVACSCRFVGGRSLGDCQKDMEGPIAWVSLSDDTAAHSVTANFLLLAKQTATWHAGMGCQLEPWDNRIKLSR